MIAGNKTHRIGVQPDLRRALKAVSSIQSQRRPSSMETCGAEVSTVVPKDEEREAVRAEIRDKICRIMARRIPSSSSASADSGEGNGKGKGTNKKRAEDLAAALARVIDARLYAAAVSLEVYSDLSSLERRVNAVAAMLERGMKERRRRREGATALGRVRVPLFRQQKRHNMQQGQLLPAAAQLNKPVVVRGGCSFACSSGASYSAASSHPLGEMLRIRAEREAQRAKAAVLASSLGRLSVVEMTNERPSPPPSCSLAIAPERARPLAVLPSLSSPADAMLNPTTRHLVLGSLEVPSTMLDTKCTEMNRSFMNEESKVQQTPDEHLTC
eukprot:CAMPEP_0113537404 /NCGR_PEP_ID=MMETSP0015_2-20120614/6806_1 /TAXON_ID=2838 /ORGANISM="Odontella" /LENGTH=327 /DNA_ID=CAMNT_0000436893 /DNA_START=256 /DNA_END=1239 /DNA_ORIENTATION=- /assembly_acc=CAM_ASM_000160